MWRSWLVRCVCLLVVPLLAVLTPETAHAAATYGTPASASFQVDADGGIASVGSVNCEVSAYWMLDGTVQNVKGSLRCSSNWAISDLVGNAYVFKGAGCSVSGGSSTQLDGGAVAALFAGPTIAPCVVDTVCVTLTFRWHTMMPWEDAASQETCVAIGVGGPEGPAAPADSACTGLTLKTPVLGPPTVKQEADAYVRHWYERTVTFEVVNTGTSAVSFWGHGALAASAGTSAYSDTGVYQTFKGARIGRYQQFTSQPGTTSTFVMRLRVGPTILTGSYAVPAGLTHHPVAGAGYLFFDLNSNPNGVHFLGSGVSGSRAGATHQAPYCSAWFGEKLAEVPDVSTDEPAGPLPDSPYTAPGSVEEPPPVTEPAPSGDSCNFDVTSPSTWFCGLADMFMAILRAIRALPGAIGALLEALFMPHPDTWGVEDFIDEVKGRPPFSIITGIGDVAESTAAGWSSASDCAGNLLRLPIQDSAAASVSCNAVRNAEGMSGLYLLAQLAIWGAAGWGIWNMVQTSIQRSAS